MKGKKGLSNKVIKLKLIIVLFVVTFVTSIYANVATTTNTDTQNTVKAIKQKIAAAAEHTTYQQRVKTEQKVEKNPFAISLYKPTYVLPYYYTANPDDEVYGDTLPDKQKLNRSEFKAQFSFKAPVWNNIFHSHTDLYVAYTQLFYWQLYAKSPFFRETNYEPEIYLTHHFTNWFTSNVSIVHQSNGRGGDMERSWNRVYFEQIFSLGDFMVSVKPWILIFKRGSSDIHNPDITHYLGYGQALLAFKWHKNVFSIMGRNCIESGFRRGALELSWSFPLFSRFSGYVQYFTGYGQSLIEYNHYTNSVGIGIMFNNWI